jgi:hypothetical protein
MRDVSECEPKRETRETTRPNGRPAQVVPAAAAVRSALDV